MLKLSEEICKHCSQYSEDEVFILLPLMSVIHLMPNIVSGNCCDQRNILFRGTFVKGVSRAELLYPDVTVAAMCYAVIHGAFKWVMVH